MGVGEIVKKVRHPEERLRESKRVNQVAGLLGRGKEEKKHTEQARSHASRPIGSLQDPSSFGAPPKHRDYYGEKIATASIPTSASTTPVQSPTSSTTRTPTVPPKPTFRSGPTVPPRIGTPSSGRDRSESPEKPAGPFKIDTTGLSTISLPVPPTHRDKREVNTQSIGKTSQHSAKPGPSRALVQPTARPSPPPPPPRNGAARAPPPLTKPKPILPPRAAVAGGFQTDVVTPESPPPPYEGYNKAEQSVSPPVGELQQRFAAMRSRVNESSDYRTVPINPQTPPAVPLGTKPQ